MNLGRRVRPASRPKSGAKAPARWDGLACAAKIALFDPEGETGALLNRLGIQSKPVETGRRVVGYDLLIVGKSALTVGAAPDIRRADGLKVIVFEQTSEVLEKRFGFPCGGIRLETSVPRFPITRFWRGQRREPARLAG